MVLVGAMAPFAAAPMHAVAPHVQSQPRQITSFIEKPTARSPLICRSMASDMQPDGSTQGHKVPKAEPFNQSRLSRLQREPSLLEKAEHALAGMPRPFLLFSTHVFAVSKFRNSSDLT